MSETTQHSWRELANDKEMRALGALNYQIATTTRATTVGHMEEEIARNFVNRDWIDASAVTMLRLVELGFAKPTEHNCDSFHITKAGRVAAQTMWQEYVPEKQRIGDEEKRARAILKRMSEQKESYLEAYNHVLGLKIKPPS